jgi:hypothetical protein
VSESQRFRVGPHEVELRITAGRWTAAVDGCPVTGFFGTEAQAAGAALVTIAGRERAHAVVSTGVTLVC